MPKRKFDKLRDDEAIEREKKWRKQKLRCRREGQEEIAEGQYEFEVRASSTRK